ncbi:MAG TPA: hypothetical protein VEB86_18945 [Chryseosolibacter sp.]|nr:hypothetical protein [Chryseosolibacter sp.]
MDTYLLISSILITLMAVSHSVVGELAIIGPLQKVPGLPALRGSIRLTKMTLRFAWHVTSVLGIGLAAILFYYSLDTGPDADRLFILKTLSLTFFAGFVVSIIGSRMKHPAWLVFLVVSILTWLGGR